MPIQPMNLLLTNSVKYITKTFSPKPFNLSVVLKNHVRNPWLTKGILKSMGQIKLNFTKIFLRTQVSLWKRLINLLKIS